MSQEPDPPEDSLVLSRKLSAELDELGDDDDLDATDEEDEAAVEEPPSPENSLVLSRKLSAELDELGDDDLSDLIGDEPAEAPDKEP
jgi:hypothetical protein